MFYYQSLEEDEDELEPPLKRLRRRGEGVSASASNNPDLGSPNLEEHTTHDEDTTISLPFHPQPTENNADAGYRTLPCIAYSVVMNTYFKN